MPLQKHHVLTVLSDKVRGLPSQSQVKSDSDILHSRHLIDARHWYIIPTEGHCKPHLCHLLFSVAGSLLYRLIKLFLDQDNIFLTSE